MARPKPKFVCNSCNTIFNKKPGVQQQTCWNCGSTDTQGVAKKQEGGKVATPAVAAPTTPSIPTPPKAPDFKPKPATGGGGAITADMLIAQKKGLKKVVRPAKALPGEAASAIPRGIRVIANDVRATLIMNARVGILSKMTEFPGYYFQGPRSVDVARELGLIAQGKVNPAHGNFNTWYKNMGLELPTGLKYRGPRHPLAGTEIDYYEYGWNRTIDPASQWYEETGRNIFTAVSKRCQGALKGYWTARNGIVNVDRLIIAESGEVFYTPDHYLTFFRYSPKFLAWYAYVSDEKSSGVGADWDDSFYEDPAA